MKKSTNEGSVRKAKKVLCFIPTRPSDLHFATIQSILNQTYPVEMIAIFPNKGVEGETIAEKVSKVLNTRLPHIKLEHFDYILRVDADTVLPPNFLEENLRDEPDICGGSGRAMLIKTSSFLRVMKGKFHPKSDDSYTFYKFMKEGCKVVKSKVTPVLLREGGRGLTRYFYRGKAMYKLGYEPFHVFASCRFRLRYILAIFGYFYALLRREQKFDVADYVWQKQIRKLLSLF